MLWLSRRKNKCLKGRGTLFLASTYFFSVRLHKILQTLYNYIPHCRYLKKPSNIKMEGKFITIARWCFLYHPLIKSSHLKMYKMYSQQIFSLVQLHYRFLLLPLQSIILKPFPSSMQSTFCKHASNPSLLSAILNLHDENLTSL